MRVIRAAILFLSCSFVVPAIATADAGDSERLKSMLAGDALGTTPWVPGKWSVHVAPSYAWSSFDSFFDGNGDSVSGDSVKQHTAGVNLKLGLPAGFAFDTWVGYTSAALGDSSSAGLADIRGGVAWQILDEFSMDASWVPTLTMRLGLVVEGTYARDNLVSDAGERATGGEAGLSFGKVWADLGMGIYGDVGYRYLLGGIPATVSSSLGAYYAFLDGFVGRLTMRHDNDLSGDDLGVQARYVDLHEAATSANVGFGYYDGGGRYYGMSVALVLMGKNTPKKVPVVGLLVSVPVL